MSNFKINLDNTAPEMREVDYEKEIKKADKKASVNVSANILKKMKKIAGLKGEASPNAILQAYILTTLNQSYE